MIIRRPRYSQRSPLLSDLPFFVEETCAIKGLVLLQEILIRHPEGAVIPKSMVELLHPLWCPFFASVTYSMSVISFQILRRHTPSSFPFISPPRVPQETQSLSINLDSFKDGVGMSLDNTLPLSPHAPKDPSSATEKKLFVDFQKLFLPEVLLVEDIRTKDFSRDTPSQVLKSLSSESSLDCTIVAVSLRIGLLQQWQPSLIRIFALCKIQCP